MTRTDRPRPPREPVDGVLLLDKPTGISSNAALQRTRRALGAAKAGHTGTLDPLASGLLPLALGESTKFSQALLDADKAYRATVCLGVTTTTGDAEGEVIARASVDVSAAQIAAVVDRFAGEIEQLPPMYSALKHAGKPLYAYAREGVDIKRKRRRVTIHEIACTLLSSDTVELVVRCSKGTYVRTLGEDIGHALGCGAHLTALQRTAIGRFSLDEAHPLPLIEAEGLAARARLLPVDALIDTLDRLSLSPDDSHRLCHGQTVSVVGVGPGEYRVYGSAVFLGLGRVSDDGVLRPRRLVNTAQGA